MRWPFRQKFIQHKPGAMIWVYYLEPRVKRKNQLWRMLICLSKGQHGACAHTHTSCVPASVHHVCVYIYFVARSQHLVFLSCSPPCFWGKVGLSVNLKLSEAIKLTGHKSQWSSCLCHLGTEVPPPQVLHRFWWLNWALGGGGNKAFTAQSCLTLRLL